MYNPKKSSYGDFPLVLYLKYEKNKKYLYYDSRTVIPTLPFETMKFLFTFIKHIERIYIIYNFPFVNSFCDYLNFL